MNKRSYFLLIINFIGAFVSLFSLLHTERLNRFISNHSLVCDWGKHVSCSATYLSEYAYIFGLPVSLFALLFFLFVFVMVLTNSKEKDTGYPILCFLNTIALLICLCYLLVLVFVLRNFCITCMLIDTAVLLNFITLFPYFRKTFYTPYHAFAQQLFKNNWITLLSLLFLLTTGTCLYKGYQFTNQKKDKALLTEFFRQKPYAYHALNNSIKWGNNNGKVKIMIFSDFLCGYCKQASHTYRKIFKDSLNVQIEFICCPIYIDSNTQSIVEDQDLFISKAILAAKGDPEFWSYYELVIALDFPSDSATVFKIAETNLSDYSAFHKNFVSVNYDSIFSCNKVLAKEYHAMGTPSVFINGRELRPWANVNLLKMIISKISDSNP